jgi:hypothetical protein
VITSFAGWYMARRRAAHQPAGSLPIISFFSWSRIVDKTDDTAGSPEECLKVIKNWFKARCNGWWEHHCGFSLETTDNPGWLASFELYTTEAEANLILANPLNRNDVDVSVQNGRHIFRILVCVP